MPPSVQSSRQTRSGLTTERGAPVDFSRRADLSELMDEPCAYETLRACLQSLERVNRLLGSYRPTLAFLDRVAASRPGAPLHIVDVGSGYGDMLRRVRRWAIENHIVVTLTGIDLNPNASRAAGEADQAAGIPPDEIRWVTGDAMRAADQPVDVVLSSLFTHHLPPREILRFLGWMDATARRGWLINDLERRRLPYHLFGIFSRVMRMHPFVQHDGPVSFRRAFRRDDWGRMLSEAGVPSAGTRIFRAFPARLCVERIR